MKERVCPNVGYTNNGIGIIVTLVNINQYKTFESELFLILQKQSRIPRFNSTTYKVT